MKNRPTILHITAGYPDQVSQNRTMAIYNLTGVSKNFDHIIVSINRLPLPQKQSRSTEKNVNTFKYWGLPYGFGLKYFLVLLTKSIEKVIQHNNIKFDMIHAHKLTIEGIVANILAKKFGKPFVCTFRGSTDKRIMKYKPSYRNLYRSILKNCCRVFLLAPWATKVVKNTLSVDITNKQVLLPNIITGLNSSSDANKIVISNRFIIAFRLDYYKIKNIKKIIQAFDIAVRKLGDIHFDIFGGGRSISKSKIMRMINASDNSSRIHLLGAISNHALCSRLGRYAGFIQPSYPESFGMVYLEALFAGIPIVHAKNTGVDGYFPDGYFSFGVGHKSVEDISEAMIDVYRNQRKYKNNLRVALKSGWLDLFMTESIVEKYSQHIHQSISEFTGQKHVNLSDS